MLQINSQFIKLPIHFQVVFWSKIKIRVVSIDTGSERLASIALEVRGNVGSRTHGGLQFEDPDVLTGRLRGLDRLGELVLGSFKTLYSSKVVPI